MRILAVLPYHQVSHIYLLMCFVFLVGSGPPSLQNEFDNVQTVERPAETDTLKPNQATSPQDQSNAVTNPVMTTSSTGRSTTKTEKRSANTLYQELSFQDNEESEENEVTGLLFVPFDLYSYRYLTNKKQTKTNE